MQNREFQLNFGKALIFQAVMNLSQFYIETIYRIRSYEYLVWIAKSSGKASGAIFPFPSGLLAFPPCGTTSTCVTFIVSSRGSAWHRNEYVSVLFFCLFCLWSEQDERPKIYSFFLFWPDMQMSDEKRGIACSKSWKQLQIFTHP